MCECVSECVSVSECVCKCAVPLIRPVDTSSLIPSLERPPSSSMVTVSDGRPLCTSYLN